MIRVKICGMTSVEDVRACAAAGADALGFIFADSPRRLTVERARELLEHVPPFVTTVGVFANDDDELVRAVIAACPLDLLQFSGDESAQRCGSFGKPTIVAARDRRWSSQDRAAARAVAVLVDSWSASEFGGTGRAAPLERARRARDVFEGTAIVLAGGLTPSSVAALVRAAKPDAVDVRTGVERDGKKDPALARAFVAAARDALS